MLGWVGCWWSGGGGGSDQGDLAVLGGGGAGAGTERREPRDEGLARAEGEGARAVYKEAGPAGQARVIGEEHSHGSICKGCSEADCATVYCVEHTYMHAYRIQIVELEGKDRQIDRVDPRMLYIQNKITSHHYTYYLQS